jgi:hypothetical protein
MRFRVELRAGWLSWLILAVAAGLAGGVLVAAAGGARRTDSVLARHVARYEFADATVFLGDDRPTAEGYAYAIAGLPQVESSNLTLDAGFVARDAMNRPVYGDGPHAVRMYASAGRDRAAAIDRPKLISGRLARPNRRHEVVVDRNAASTFGVKVGDRIAVAVYADGQPLDYRDDPRTITPPGYLVRLRVVGVSVPTEATDFPGGVVRLTPTFYTVNSAYHFGGPRIAVRLKGGAAALSGFRSAVEQIVGLRQIVSQRERMAPIRDSIHLQAQALWLGTALGALLAAILLFQALTRLATAAAFTHPALVALGMSRRQLLALGMLRGALIAAGATALAVLAAAALSPLAPIGLARDLEPDPGFMLDSIAVGLGGALVLATTMLAGAWGAWRATRPRAVASVPSAPLGGAVADRLARWGLPASAVTGVRFALSRGRGATGTPVGVTVFSAVLGVAVAATALTFSASLDHLFATPGLYGQTWDYRYLTIFEGSADTMRRQTEAEVRKDPTIQDAAFGIDEASVLVAGRRVGVRAMDRLKGGLSPAVIEGRAPLRANEILLGTKTLTAIGRDIGDIVEVQAQRRASMRIVGRGIVVGGRGQVTGFTGGLGEGAAMTYRDFTRIADETPPDCCVTVELRFAPGVDRDGARARLSGSSDTQQPALPRGVADFGGVDRMPLVLSGLLVLIAAGALTQALLAAVRRRSHDLAVLKTIGFDRRQVLVAVASQATTYAAVGLIIGLPLGVAAGHWAWNLFAEELGVVPETKTPALLLVLVIPGALLLANLVAAVPARIAARTHPALVLRAE